MVLVLDPRNACVRRARDDVVLVHEAVAGVEDRRGVSIVGRAKTRVRVRVILRVRVRVRVRVTITIKVAVRVRRGGITS